MNTQSKSLMMVTVLVGSMSTQASAQQTVTVIPGEHYAASPTHEWFLGAGYRELWQAPLRVPVLNLQTFAGGLEPVRDGGGRQTNTLHLRGRDGRQYIFRSMIKNPSRALPPELAAFGITPILRDARALFHPSGARMVPPLLEAVGVLHATPQLYLMPQDASLGKYQPVFGGILGYLEERPEEGADDSKGFADSKKILGSQKFDEKLREDSRNQVAEREWLAARLIDFVVGDTDRGSNQWRWARFDDGDGFRWRPIPRDRDFAFIHADGVVPRSLRFVFKRLARFNDELPDGDVLTHTAMHDDRYFTQSLDGATWAQVAKEVQDRLTDAVIDQAAQAMPPEHYALSGAEVAHDLRKRRDALVEYARDYYELLAEFVDVHGSDQPEFAEILRFDDGSVEVKLYRGGPKQVAMGSNGHLPAERTAFYRRVFLPSETEEIRIHLHGADDRIVIGGPNTDDAITVRIIAGAGNDELIDSSTNGEGGDHTRFYDDDSGRVQVTRGKHTEVDRRPFTEPPRREAGLSGDPWRFRDWGGKSGLSPAIDFRANTGFLVGVQYGQREYGFRRVPIAWEWRTRVLYAPGAAAFGADLEARQYFENSAWGLAMDMRVSGYDDLRFFGYGNDTPEIDSDESLVERNYAQALGSVRYGLGDTRAALGLSMELNDTEVEQGTPFAFVQPLGTHDYAQFGLWSSLQSDVGDRVFVGLDGAFYPAAASLPEAYGKGRGTAVVRIGSKPELALRGMGEKIWGDAPYFDAAFVGGRKQLRGYTSYRYAGDASLVGNAELRFPFSNAIGAFLLADAGRVYLDGASPGGWHSAYGGGVAFTVAGHDIVFTYAVGEDSKFYVTLGRAF